MRGNKELNHCELCERLQHFSEVFQPTNHNESIPFFNNTGEELIIFIQTQLPTQGIKWDNLEQANQAHKHLIEINQRFFQHVIDTSGTARFMDFNEIHANFKKFLTLVEKDVKILQGQKLKSSPEQLNSASQNSLATPLLFKRKNQKKSGNYSTEENSCWQCCTMM